MTLLPLFVFWCLWFLNFCNRASFAPILPLIEDSLSLSHGETGGLVTSYSTGYAVMLLIAGRFVSTWGHKRTVAMGFIGTGLLYVMLQWLGSYPALLLLFLFLGLTTGSYLPSIFPIITESYDPEHWGKALGFHDSAASVALFSAPILITLGLQFFAWKEILLFLGGLSILFPVFFWKVSREPTAGRYEQKSRYSDLLKRKPVILLSVLWVLCAACNAGVYSILPLYLIKERGMDYALTNNLVGISRVGGIAVQVFIGFWVDRYGYKKILAAILVSAGLATLSLSVAPTPTLLWVAVFCQAVFSIAFFPAGLATIARLTPLAERPMTIGIIISIGVIFGSGWAPFLLGVIADHYSFQIGIVGLGILTALSALSLNCLAEK